MVRCPGVRVLPGRGRDQAEIRPRCRRNECPDRSRRASRACENNACRYSYNRRASARMCGTTSEGGSASVRETSSAHVRGQECDARSGT